MQKNIRHFAEGLPLRELRMPGSRITDVRRLAFIATAFLTTTWLVAGALFCEATLRVSRHPVRPGPESRSSHEVAIAAADGIRLRGSFLAPRGPSRGCVLLLHGVADSRASTLGLAQMFVAGGYSALAIDSRGHGASGGDLITFGLLEREDVLRWAAWLRGRGCPALYGLGESMGAAILIQAAAQQPVFAAIVAECPFSDLWTIAQDRVVQVAPGPNVFRRTLASAIVPSGFFYARVRYGLDLHGVSPATAVVRMKTPVLVIHGDADRNISSSHSRVIASAGPSVSLWLVPGAGHTSAATHAPQEFRTKVLRWFDLHRPLPGGGETAPRER